MNFTYGDYFLFISDLVDRGYKIVNFGHPSDLPSLDSPFVILRHDIDVCLESALRLAEREAEQGIRSTYFLMISNRFYNLNSSEGLRVIRAIRSMGHQIALHFDETVRPIPDVPAFNAAVSLEATMLSNLAECPVVGVSFHRPTPVRINSGMELTSPLPHTYLPTYVSEMDYCSDSTGRWRYGPPTTRESIANGRPLHLLTHPIWWDEHQVDPQVKLSEFVRRNHQSTIDCLISELDVVPDT